MTARDSSSRLPRRSLLERLVTAHTKDNGIAAKRIRHWISSMVILGALDIVRAEDDSRHFVITGGVALERRLGPRARATRDVDLTLHGDPAKLTGAPMKRSRFLRQAIDTMDQQSGRAHRRPRACR